MKKIALFTLIVLFVAMVLVSCGSFKCSVCYKQCSDSNSYKDGEYILCGECKNKMFKDTVKSEPDDFFAELITE